MSDALPLHPRVGVGVIVRREGRVLLGLRKGSHGAGTWALPGGHLEFGESVEACAARETEEETGLRLSHLRLGPFTNDVMQAEAKHYVTVFVIAEAEPGDVELREPHKCERWAWFAPSALPQPLFQPLQSLLARGLRLEAV
ncbi:MAG: nucleotide triphosphate diphosphatase NUDT15 [Rubrivivax sp.]